MFTTSVHAPLQLTELERRAKILKKSISRAKELGFKAGINILTTIGHHEEDLDNSLKGPYFNMTGADGKVCRGSFCMNDKRFIEEYVRPVYTALAKASPDHIWIDDDVRYGHMPIGNGCFCDGCIDKFNRENGTAFDRQQLLEELDKSMTVRKAWLRHNINAITNLFRAIGDAVRSVDKSITLGFMTGERYFEGYAFNEFAEALSENGKYEIMWRPGGGAYTDYRFDEIVEKSEQMGRQSAYLPPYVTVIHSEIENFPYQLIKKTPTSTALEAALSMTCGCTGAAFNIVPSESGEPTETIVPHLKAITRLSKFYGILAEKTGGKQPYGICTGWRPDSQLAVPMGEFMRNSGGMYASFARELFDFGLPQCYKTENASVTVISGQNTLNWTDGEIKTLLSKGVYMDVSALDHLNSKGYSDYTGFCKEKEIPVDAIEKYGDGELNGGISGGTRNCRQAFNGGDSFSIKPKKENTESLASIIDYHGNTVGDCCLGIYKNSLGGTVCVGGYYPFSWISDYRKTAQLKNIMLKLSGYTLPSYVESYCRIRNHSFVDGDKCTVTLCNPTNELLEDVKIAIKTNSESVTCYTMDGSSYKLFGEPSQNKGYKLFAIEKIPSYEMVLIES